MANSKVLKLTLSQGHSKISNFSLTKRKILVGSGPHSDIKIEDKHISFYHALIILDENGGGEIIDLKSDNGSYLNGKKIEKSFFFEGDYLRFSELEFRVEEDVEVQKIENQDQAVTRLKRLELVPPPPQVASLEGLVLIDGEYCDITFKENYIPLNELPIGKTLDFKGYIDFYENDKSITSDKIIKTSKQKSLEVAILSNGHIISVDYLPFSGKEQTFYFSDHISSSNTVCLEILESGDKIPFFKFHGGKPHFCKINGQETFNLSEGSGDLFSKTEIVAVDLNDTISYRSKTIQIFIKLVDSPPRTKYAPFFGRDKEFQKDAGKVFGILISLMFLLLLVDITPPTPPEKKLAIIYKRAPKLEKAKTPEANSSVDDNQGVKEHHKPDQKIEMAKKADPAPAAKPQKSESAPPAPQKMAAYEFKSSSLNSLFSSDSLKNTETKKSGRSVANSKNFEGVGADSSALKTGSGNAVGTLGSDHSGSGNVSSGAKGLISKNGTDSTYVEPKTVILGSIDPELLRKILQEYIPQFRHCYQQELEQNESIQGVVDLNFRIENDGRASKVNIKVKNASFSAAGTNCMGNVLKVIDFPKPKGGGHVDVKQPLNFFSERNKI